MKKQRALSLYVWSIYRPPNCRRITRVVTDVVIAIIK